VTFESPLANPPKDSPTADFAGTKMRAFVCRMDAAAPRMWSKMEWDKAIRSVAAAPDGTLYVVDHETKVRHYKNVAKTGCDLALDDSFGTNGVWEMPDKSQWRSVSVDAKGTVYVSGDKGHKIVDGKLSDHCAESTKTSAFSTLIVADKHISKDGSCSGPYFTNDGFDPNAPQYGRAYPVTAIGDEIISNGMDMEGKTEVHKAGFHTADGKLRIKVGKSKGDEYLSGVDGATKCGDDICLVSGSIIVATIRRYAKDGTFRGRLLTRDLGVDMKEMGINATPAGMYVHGSMLESSKDGNEFAGVIVLVTKAE